MSTISFSGIGSSIDTAAIVDALVQSEIAPQRQLLSERRSSIDAQISALGKLKSALSVFQDAAKALNSASKFMIRSASSSDTSRLGVTASSDAVAGTYQIEVDTLAQQQKLITATGLYADSQATVGSGTLNFTVGTETFDVPIAQGTDSLANVRDAINSAEGNSGVVATIVNVDDGANGTEARLLITSKTGGVDNQITITAIEDLGNPGLANLAYDSGTATGSLVEQQAAVDALVYIDGLAATRSSNSIEDLIDGVQIDLLKAEQGVQIEVTVSNDTDAMVENVQEFVDAYNQLRESIKTLSENKDTSPLLADSLVSSVYRQIRGALSDPVSSSSGGIETLVQAGLSIDRYGAMSIESTVLRSALDSNLTAITDLFSSADGISSRIESVLDSYTESKGVLELRAEGLNERLQTLTKSEERLDYREESMFLRLSRKYVAMEKLIAQLNSSGSFLVSQLGNGGNN